MPVYCLCVACFEYVIQYMCVDQWYERQSRSDGGSGLLSINQETPLTQIRLS